MNGDALPDLSLPSVAGPTVSLSEYIRAAWSVVLFYRGNWCPYCNAQLSAFQRKLFEIEQLGARVVAISADVAEEAQKTVERHHIAFPVLFGADPSVVAKTFGAHRGANAHGAYIDSTGFIVDPTGVVVVAVYSSGAIGRIVADDALGFMKYLRSRVGAVTTS